MLHTLKCATLVCVSAFLLVSCSDLLGYGVVLWSLPEHGLDDGEIVPVYLKSTISQVYVIALPTTNEKIEVPLWQITDPVSKRKAEKQCESYIAYQHQYAATLLDGLPVRQQAVNTSRQVYRLRKDEVLKILYKGTGQPVMAGDTPMEGDWLRVLTSDGTEGWCFSHNLRLFDIRYPGSMSTQDTSQTEIIQAELAEVFAKNWRPESYLPMILNNAIDLSQMNVEYGFTIDIAKKSGRLQLATVDLSFEFSSIIKEPGELYMLEGSPISLYLRDNDLLVVSYTNNRGIPIPYNFIPIDEPIDEIINMEIERRERLFADLLSLGPDFTSENHGSLHFSSGGNVTWTDNQMLVPFVISARSSPRGTVEFKYFIGEQLQAIFDGVITISLDGSEKENNFFYSIQNNGIQLEDASGVLPQNNIFSSRALNHTVMFFEKR
jgi:hypothetical protein